MSYNIYRMKTSNIQINSSNVVPNSNNSKLEYTFPIPKLITNASIALHSLQMYYSWFNINASLYNNHQFKYKWWSDEGVLNETFTVSIPDGFYSLGTMNLYFQSVMLGNGHYLYDSDLGKNIFYMELLANETYYSAQLNITPMYAIGTAPVQIIKNGSWQYPAVQSLPIVQIISAGNFKDLVGFNAGSYPSKARTTLFQHLSDYTPQLSPVSSVVMRCNLVKNDDALPNDVLYSFTSGDTGFGNIINEKPNELYFSEISSGTFNKIQISFYDQLFNPIHINDPQLLMTLLIKEN
jgi:hypothetical protein